MQGKPLLIAALLLAAAGCASKIGYPVGPTLPTKDELAKVWVGTTEGQVFEYRLTLLPSGEGVLGRADAENRCELVRIKKWRVRGPRVKMVLSEEETDKFAQAYATASGARLLLTLFERPRWVTKVELLPEPVVSSRHEALVRAMDKLNSMHQP